MILGGKRGQGSFEFMILVAFMFFILVITFALIQGRTIGIDRERNYVRMQQVGNMISVEMGLAESIEGIYFRTFSLPYLISGRNYTVNITGPAEISIWMEGYEHVVFLNSNVSGEIHKGENRIMKAGSNITINA